MVANPPGIHGFPFQAVSASPSSESTNPFATQQSQTAAYAKPPTRCFLSDLRVSVGDVKSSALQERQRKKRAVLKIHNGPIYCTTINARHRQRRLTLFTSRKNLCSSTHTSPTTPRMLPPPLPPPPPSTRQTTSSSLVGHGVCPRAASKRVGMAGGHKPVVIGPVCSHDNDKKTKHETNT